MKRPNSAFLSPESTADRKTRLARDMPQARAAYEAERAAIDARTIKLRALRLARDAAEQADPPAAGAKEKNGTAIGRAVSSRRGGGKSA